MIGSHDRGRRGQGRREGGGVLAVLGHHLLHELAGGGGVGEGRAGHPGEDDALHDVHVREPAAEAADEGVAESQQPLRDAAGVHELGRQDEQRNGQQDLAPVHPVEQLLGGGAHVEPRQEEIEHRPADHGVADGQPEQAEADDGRDGGGERAGERHSAEPAPGRSGSVDLLAPEQAGQDPDVADDDGDDEDHVDREQIVEADLEIGRALDLHEADVVERGRERHRVQGHDRDPGHDARDAAGAGAERAVEEIEADLLALPHHEGGAPEHPPQPGDDGQLRRPADREVQEVAEDDLQQEREEHDGQHGRQDILRAAPQPPPELPEERTHGSAATGR